MAQIRIFLSCVSAEFGRYRDVLRHYLDRPNVTVKVQEEFIVTGTETLDMLDAYIAQCDVVIHLVGDMTGAMAQAPSVEAIATRYPDLGRRFPVSAFLQTGAPPLSYTQWEAWLALYHGKRLIIAAPENDAERDARYTLDPSQQAAQQAHLARLAQVERYPGIHFRSADQFAAEVWRSGLLDLLIEAGLVRKVVHLRYLSLGDLFKGRASLLDELGARLGPVLARTDRPATVTALTGIGGVGKTRLAVEYAWRQTGDYTAMLLVGADSAAALNTNLAALCSATILDLPERDEKDEVRRRDAVVRWLQAHPGWLLILDNVDSKSAASAVRTLLPQLIGGHVLITSRLSNWPASIPALPVELLSPESATDFLLTRTQAGRRTAGDDRERARDLAHELGYLALALEQAAAYIATLSLSFAQYGERWQRQRDAMLAWYDAEQMDYPKSLAITWRTSFEQLGEAARRLLRRLAWLAPEPVPESLLEVPVRGADASEADPTGHDPLLALAELRSYSLVTRSANAREFSVHRLVQEIVRHEQRDERIPESLVHALNWLNEAYSETHPDVRRSLATDPLALLAPHALTVAKYADAAGHDGPCAFLFSEVGLLLHRKAIYGDAEPLMRRALEIDKAVLGESNPQVATDFSNLAQLLQSMGRLSEAEQMMRQALAIDEEADGDTNPMVARDLNNLAAILGQAEDGRLEEAESLARRALSIDEAHFGASHPEVATDLNNLAQLLKATGQIEEAESLMRRALEIDGTNARDLLNLAALLLEDDRPDEAKPLMQQALASDEANYDEEHPRVAIGLNNLARLLWETNHLAEAEPLMHRALAIMVRRYGLDHSTSRVVVENYIGLMQALGRPNGEIRAVFASLSD